MDMLWEDVIFEAIWKVHDVIVCEGAGDKDMELIHKISDELANFVTFSTFLRLL